MKNENTKDQVVVVSRYHLSRTIALLTELQEPLLARVLAADGSRRETLENMLSEVQQLTSDLILESKYLNTQADVEQHQSWAKGIINTLRGQIDDKDR